MYYATSSPNHTRMDCVSTSTCCSLITATTIVRTYVASQTLPIFLQIVWTCFRFSTPQNPIRAAHCVAVNLFCPVAESPAIAPFNLIAVFAPRTKKISACFTDNDAAAATTDPAFIWGAATFCASVNFPIVPSSHSFCQDFNSWYERVTTVMSVSAALDYLFLIFTQLHISHSIIGRTMCFAYLSFGSTRDFKILCNSHDIFSSPQKIGPRIEGSMTTIGIDVVVFLCPAQCQVLKLPLWLRLS